MTRMTRQASSQCVKQNWPCSGGTCAGAGLWPAMCWGRPQACQLVPEQAPSLPTCAGAGPRPANLIVPGQATAAPLQHPLKTINFFFMLGCQLNPIEAICEVSQCTKLVHNNKKPNFKFGHRRCAVFFIFFNPHLGKLM